MRPSLPWQVCNVEAAGGVLLGGGRGPDWDSVLEPKWQEGGGPWMT